MPFTRRPDPRIRDALAVEGGEAMFGLFRRRVPAAPPVPRRPPPAPPPRPAVGMRRPIGFGAQATPVFRPPPGARRVGFGVPQRPTWNERWRAIYERLEAERAGVDAQLGDLRDALATGALPAGDARRAAARLLARRATVAARLQRIGATVPPPPFTL
jgi:hypothetical protein